MESDTLGSRLGRSDLIMEDLGRQESGTADIGSFVMAGRIDRESGATGKVNGPTNEAVIDEWLNCRHFIFSRR